MQRQAARERRDFVRADELRAELASLGYQVRDTPLGQTVERAPRYNPVTPAAIHNVLDRPPTLQWSIHLLYEGFRADLERFLTAFGAHNDTSGAEVVVVDNASAEGDLVHQIAERFAFARALHLDRDSGWAGARNAGLKTSRGSLLVLADLSIEPTGDILTPLAEAFTHPSVGIAGPFGLVSDDMREWREDPGPEVDAIEGYLMAIRREALVRALINERFKWYRNADIDLSFQVKALGYQARAVPLPVAKHAHRGWEAVEEGERTKRSKRNHGIFFDRWKARRDLLRSHRGVR